MSDARPKIAIWFRYGPDEHTELYPALPGLVAALAREADVHYFCFRSERQADPALLARLHLHELPWRVHRTDNRDKWRKTLLWIALLPWLGLRCRRLGARAIFLDESLPLAPALLRLCCGRRAVASVADFFLDIYAPRSAAVRAIKPAIEAIDRWGWRGLGRLFTRTRSMREHLVRQRVPENIVRTVYDPCDFTVYHPLDRAQARAALGLPADSVTLVHHGILHPNKGNDFILRALAPLKRTHPHFRYLLVGDGPEMAHLRALASELGLDEMVVFTGWLKTLREVNVALNAGDIGFVMRVGSESDHFHLTGALVHSLACGLPVLAVRLSGIQELVRENENGLLFAPGDADEFRAQLVRLIDDPALRDRLGAAALRTARENFSMDQVVQQTAGALLEIARA